MSFSSLFSPSTAEKKTERVSSSLFLGGFLAICSSFSTLTPVMAARFQNLASFNGSNGSFSEASLTLGNNGLFYGTTYSGGSSNRGTIFSFNPTGNVLSSLASFNGPNGRFPRASLTLGNNGLFYGITNSGGSSDYGTIFSFNPTSNVLSPLANFDFSNGVYPLAGLTLGTDGLFYGTTQSGGIFDRGTIFSFNPTSNVLSPLASFNGSNGSLSRASLTLDPNGLFYGTTYSGGSSNRGTIFSFNPTGNVLSSLASFNDSNGNAPFASLTLGTDGLFYGTTQQGGSSGAGTIFSFNPTSNVLSSLASFNGPNGSFPSASLTLGTDGIFYGTTDFGGSNFDAGTIFSFNPTSNVLSSLAFFDGFSGSLPRASPTLDTNGLFYGTTYSGGSSNRGTIFSFDAGLTPPPQPPSVIEPSSLLGLLSLGTALTFKRRKTSNSTPRERNTNS
jgi:uncharacterized repeat protein (TIGR03803 family)